LIGKTEFGGQFSEPSVVTPVVLMLFLVAAATVAVMVVSALMFLMALIFLIVTLFLRLSMPFSGIGLSKRATACRSQCETDKYCKHPE
jgi:type IV secretory pathway TrbL component